MALKKTGLDKYVKEQRRVVELAHKAGFTGSLATIGREKPMAVLRRKNSRSDEMIPDRDIALPFRIAHFNSSGGRIGATKEGKALKALLAEEYGKDYNGLLIWDDCGSADAAYVYLKMPEELRAELLTLVPYDDYRGRY